MTNPFDLIDSRLSNIENILLDITTSPKTSAPPGRQDDEILTVPQVAEFLRLSVNRIYQLISEGTIPNFKKGRRVLFSKAELVAWLKTGRRKTVDEVRIEAEGYIKNKKRDRV